MKYWAITTAGEGGGHTHRVFKSRDFLYVLMTLDEEKKIIISSQEITKRAYHKIETYFNEKTAKDTK